MCLSRMGEEEMGEEAHSPVCLSSMGEEEGSRFVIVLGVTANHPGFL